MISILLEIKIGLDPTIVDVIGLEITWHGLFTALGVIVGVAISSFLARRMNYPEDMIYNVALALVIGGIIGARGLYVIENWHEVGFDNDLGEIFAINTGGISIYGALIGGTIAGWGYALITKVPNIPRGMDIAAIGGILGMAIGRIGDIINGEHFAKSSDLPWAVVYTDTDSVAYGLGAQHPAVAYELLGDMVIFAILLFVYYKIPRAGVTFCAWVVLYGVMRFFITFLRLDDEVLLDLKMAQVVSLVTVPAALIALVYLLRTPPASERAVRARRRREGREEPAVPAPPPPVSEEPTTG